MGKVEELFGECVQKLEFRLHKSENMNDRMDVRKRFNLYETCQQANDSKLELLFAINQIKGYAADKKIVATNNKESIQKDLEL